MRLIVEVDRERERLGWLTGLSENRKRFGPVEICATVNETAARSAGNTECDPLRPCGHVPFGTYRLKEIKEMSPRLQDEYGTHALLFEPLSGEALHAESYGRLVLALHGGELGEDGRLRPTDGGLRVDNHMLNQIVSFVGEGGNVELEIKESPLGFWEGLFGRRRRPSRAHSWFTADDHNGSRTDEITREGSPDREKSFEGRGGIFGGAGASGGWEASEPAGTRAAGEQVERDAASKDSSGAEDGGAVGTATSY